MPVAQMAVTALATDGLAAARAHRARATDRRATAAGSLGRARNVAAFAAAARSTATGIGSAVTAMATAMTMPPVTGGRAPGGILIVPAPQLPDTRRWAIASARAIDIAIAIQRHGPGDRALVRRRRSKLRKGRRVNGLAVPAQPVLADLAAKQPSLLHERQRCRLIPRYHGCFRQAGCRREHYDQPRQQIRPFHGYIPPRDCLASGHSRLLPL